MVLRAAALSPSSAYNALAWPAGVSTGNAVEGGASVGATVDTIGAAPDEVASRDVLADPTALDAFVGLRGVR